MPFPPCSFSRGSSGWQAETQMPSYCEPRSRTLPPCAENQQSMSDFGTTVVITHPSTLIHYWMPKHVFASRFRIGRLSVQRSVRSVLMGMLDSF